MHPFRGAGFQPAMAGFVPPCARAGRKAVVRAQAPLHGLEIAACIRDILIVRGCWDRLFSFGYL